MAQPAQHKYAAKISHARAGKKRESSSSRNGTHHDEELEVLGEPAATYTQNFRH